MKYIISNEARRIKPRQGKEVVLYRIRAIQDFTTYALKRKIRIEGEKRTVVYQIVEKQIKVGDPGGWVQSEKNLSQRGSCWIDDEALAFGNATVCDDAYLGGKAAIGGKVKLYESTKVTDLVQLGGSIKLYGRSKVVGKGTYYDQGSYRDIYLGKETNEAKPVVKLPQVKTAKTIEDPMNPQGKIKIEILLDEKKFVNDFEF